MFYYYRFSEDHHDEKHENPKYEFYTAEEIASIPIYPLTPEIERELEEDENTDLWPIHDIDGWSWDPVDCKDENEARKLLGVSLNHSIYEYIHNL